MVQETPKLLLPSGQQIAMQILREISDMRNAIQQLVPSGMGEDYVQVMNVPGMSVVGQEVEIVPPGIVGYVYIPDLPGAARIWSGSVGGDIVGDFARGSSIQLQMPATQKLVVQSTGIWETAFTYWVTSRPIKIDASLPTNSSGYPVVEIVVDGSLFTIPLPGAPTTQDHSGTLTAGGVSQQIVGSNTNRRAIFIQNPASSGESLYFDFNGGGAVAGQPSVELVPGAYWESPASGCPVGAIDVIAATTGHPFVCKEMY